MASINARKHHAVAIPLPAQGHINSLMRLCKKLASEAGFTITFVNIEPVHDRIQELQAASAAAEEKEEGGGLDIRRAHVPIDGIDLSNNFRFSFVHFFEAMKGLAPRFEQRLRHLVATAEPPVTCLISDFYMTVCTHQLAHQFNLPRIVFYPFSATMLLFMDYVLQGDISQNQVVDALKKREKGVFCGGLSGLPTMEIQDLPNFEHLGEENEYMYELTRRELQESKNGGQSFVVNSFKEVEEEAFKVLKERMEVPVYPVGPLIEVLQEVNTATSLWKEDNACINWLDQQAPLSVLYICFGSITFFSHLQFEELVAGLLSSNYHFLFVFRPDLVESKLCSYTPSPLQMLLSSGKGYVVEWTPQLTVLSHPSVGGFLTHCGMNSIMEALANGVPMLCWPYFVDQFLNAKLVVEEWKVGLYFWAKSEPHGYFVTRNEVEKSIKALMEGDDKNITRKNAKRLKEVGYQSSFLGGTSFQSLQDLIQSI